MVPLLLLVLQTQGVTVRPGPQDACPASFQVASALERRGLQVAVSMAPSQGRPGTFFLSLGGQPPGSGLGPTMTLTDRHGELLLFRRLVSETSSTADCQALADTVGLIVERFFQALPRADRQRVASEGPLAKERAAPATAAPEISTLEAAGPLMGSARQPRWAALLGGGWQTDRPGVGGYSAHIGARWMPARLGDIRSQPYLGVSGGISGAAIHTWEAGRAELRRYQLVLSSGWSLPMGQGAWEPEVAAGVNLVRIEAFHDLRPSSRLELVPILSGGVGYRLPFSRRGFVRVAAGLGVALIRYQFADQQDAAQTLFSTGRAHGHGKLEIGMMF